MVDGGVPRILATRETVRHLAALHQLRLDEQRLEELAAQVELVRQALAALELELDGVEPAVVLHLRKES